MNAITESEFNFPGQLSVYHGKVRDVYTLKNDLNQYPRFFLGLVFHTPRKINNQ